jgi:hypothetical protein
MEAADTETSAMQTYPSTGLDTAMYQFSLWDKEILKYRRMLFDAVFLPLIYTTILMWICLSLFWGSLFDNNNLRKIGVTAVNLDDGFVGSSLIGALKSEIAGSGTQLNWNFDNMITSDSESRQLVIDEKSWAVLQGKERLPRDLLEQTYKYRVVSANASSALTQALISGISSYSPLNAVSLYVASARSQITTNSHVVPSIEALVSPILNQIAVNSTVKLLQSATSNAAVLDAALRCPQCVASPFVLRSVDLIPFDNAAATGATMTGLIFVSITNSRIRTRKILTVKSSSC